MAEVDKVDEGIEITTRGISSITVRCVDSWEDTIYAGFTDRFSDNVIEITAQNAIYLSRNRALALGNAIISMANELAD